MAKKQSTLGDYIQTLNIGGYLSNREITNLPGNYLVKGSQNCYIKNTEKVVSRPGYKILGQAKTVNMGSHSSHDWNDISSPNSARSIKVFGTFLKVFYANSWQLLKTMPTSAHMHFVPWWNKAEQIDVLLASNSSGKIYEWSGAISTVASITANTITKQRFYTSSSISFANNGAGVEGTITKLTGGFTAAGFIADGTIVVTGSASNNGTYIIKNATDTVLTIYANYTLTNEAVGASVTIQEPNGTWAGQRFLTINAGDSTDRKVLINGIEYIYTGGESTGTLTGVSPDPTANTSPITAGAIAMQAMRTYTVSTGAGANPPTTYVIDLISCVDNLVFYGSLTNRAVYQSTANSFISFAQTSPLRIPGDGMVMYPDSCPTAFIPGQKDAPMTITAGQDFIYQITYKQSTATNGSASYIAEQVIPTKINSTTGSAAISQDAVILIKNGAAYWSFEPTIDTLAHMQNILTTTPITRPISDPIKDDVESYNPANIHGIYFRRNLYYTLPKENKLIIFDMQTENHYWQPPWTMAISRLAVIIINGKATLCGHSSTSDETYILNTGTDDNGARYNVIAAFGYENYGMRFMSKVADEFATELYISPTTKVQRTIYFDYKGGSGIRNLPPIDGNDQLIISGPTQSGGSEGSYPLGYSPEGGTPEIINVLQKARIIQPSGVVDFFEMQDVYSSDSVGVNFAIIARGINARMSDNIPNQIIK
jgi:hypothetical protein